nr:uncharacterized protein LOC117226964 isoform X2 [Megalopta genalis]
MGARNDRRSLTVDMRSSEHPLEMKNVIQVSRSVVRNLTNGQDQESVDFEKSEEEWIRKLASIDNEHSEKYGLTERNIDKLFQNLDRKYLSAKADRPCPMESDTVTNCLKENKEESFSCTKAVDKFKTCIDKSYHDTVRKDETRKKSKKKGSYSEDFFEGTC